MSTSGVICVEMMRKFEDAGAHFDEVGVSHFPRPHGRSQFFRLPAIARSARQLLALWWDLMVRERTSRSLTRSVVWARPDRAAVRTTERGLAVAELDVVALADAGVPLAGAGDLLVLVARAARPSGPASRTCGGSRTAR